MNTPPRIEKYRVRKVVAAPAGVPDDADMPFALATEDDGFGDLNLARGVPAPGAAPSIAPAPAAPAVPHPAAAAAAPDAGGKPPTAEEVAEAVALIHKEPLTARNLRNARRIAQAHGIVAETDHEAVYLLRRKGIDPFSRQSLLNAPPAAEAETARDNRIDLPARVPPNKPPQKAPGAAVQKASPDGALGEAERVRAIMDMQRDIVRRRRRNLMLLMARLSIFVFLPTLIAGIYFTKLATPLFATVSAFQVQQAEPAGGGGGLGSLFRGSGFATSKDDIAVQAYLQSRDAMQQLNADLGFKAHFSQPDIDPLQRLGPDATDEEAYKIYRRNVKIAYDPTEGLIRLEVRAFDPEMGVAFSEDLIKQAENQVNRMTLRVRDDQMKGARESYEDAERKVQEAQMRVLELQKNEGVLDAKSEAQIIMGEIAELEGGIRAKQLELDQLKANLRPNAARVQGVAGDIKRLNAHLDELRRKMTTGTNAQQSIAEINGELRIAEAELLTRQKLFEAALQQVETSRIEANRQVRYLATSVAPVAEDSPTYPKAFEDTALAFLIFAGIYLMLSLTASILREQVSS